MHGALILTRELPVQDVWAGPPADFADPVIWRALRVTSGRERPACIWLKMHQLHPYWPRYRVEPTRLQNRRKIIWRSVLSGYLFLPLLLERPIDRTFFEYCPGISNWMRDGAGNVAKLTEEEIACIRRLELAMQASVIAAVEGIPFKVGDKVRIKPYGIKGTIIELVSRREIKIEAPLGGALRIWTAPGSEIEAV